MLARSFLTADELNIPPAYHDALIKVLHAFERGDIAHRSDYNVYAVSGLCFNMSTWSAEYRCGTVACIGGWAEILGDVSGLMSFSKCSNDNKLFDLFYPRSEVWWDDITVEQATVALNSYLTTGNPDWASVMSS